MAERMVELAAQQPSFIGVESVRGSDGFGITVSYWKSTQSIAAWKADVEQCAAQKMGKRAWYEHYEIRVPKVERAYRKPSAEDCGREGRFASGIRPPAGDTGL